MTAAGPQPTPEWAAPHVWEVDDARVPQWVRDCAGGLQPAAVRVVRVSDQEYVFFAADGEILDSVDLHDGTGDRATRQDPGEVLAAYQPLRMLRMGMIGFAVLSLFAVLILSIVEGLS